MSLHISPDLDLPVDAITETFAILAKRGAGKSNAAVVMAEQMYDAGLPWVAVDPKGDWWGVRSSVDGKGAGLSVIVLGGQHADVPLEPTAGRLVADLIVEQRITAVLDVSLMSKSDMRRFLADFAERLYQRNTEPLHVFAEEAHEYIPQRVDAGAARMVGAWEKLVKWGRTHGLGVTLITQRSASLNKDVLTQVETLFALRTTGPQDQAAIRAWVDEHDDGRAVIAALRKLPSGTAYVLSPQWLTLDEPKLIHFARRRTFDSGATPAAGQRRTAPRTVADVDLAAIKEAMAETIEKAKADDPKALRARIAELERQATVTPEPIVERVEVPVLNNATHALVERVIEQWDDAYDQAAETANTLRDALRRIDSPSAPVQSRVATSSQPQGRGKPTRAAEPSTAPTPRPVRADGEPGGNLGKAHRAILTVLAQHDTRTKTQVALLTGYSHRGGGFNNALSALRARALIEGRDSLTITDDGLRELGEFEPLPTGRALIDHWSGRLGKAERLILDVLIYAWPTPMPKDAIADEAGYAVSGGGFNNALSKLRSLELIDGRTDIVVADTLGSAR